MENVKVSIIVPAYNIENYVERCLNSLINQTYENIEIIIVDDGSTDNTLVKISDMARKDKRIKVLEQENRGSSEARKKGYEMSNGEFILFVDGDDWIRNDTIEVLLKYTNDDIDIVAFEYNEIFNENEIPKNSSLYNKNNEKIELRDTQFLREILTNNISINIWNKFIRKKFIDKNNVAFPMKMSYAEDLALLISLAAKEPNVIVIKEKLYFYFKRENSITSIISPKILETKDAMYFIKNILIENKLYNIYREEFEYCVYIHNWYFRYRIIYFGNNQYSKKLFKIWNNFNINIINNKYFKKDEKNLDCYWRFFYLNAINNYYLGKILALIIKIKLKISKERNENKKSIN
ncbi:glycosyltransferase family 2 protein [Clostridium perfringens]|nr:glycosyltransferase family 2 protein [Clostridium perfringens]MDM0991516.1 glycosyltransferase family 2 protein [Clostridium perfringens]